ncbi:hypothetical protein [Desertibaculum subflavum]|uniref:hypothetical protein n=1 Tax=Desertibaculum subflavum TaxID=2268458 RepID=UPI0013C44955
MRWFALVALAAIAHGCGGSQGNSSPSAATPVRAVCPAELNVFYFAPGTFDADRPDLDEFERKWFSEHLRAMEAPTLSCGRDDVALETYRFLWLRTFHHPISVHVRRTASGVTVDAVELSGAGGYEPGSISKRGSGLLSLTDWQKLDAALAVSAFWTQPTNDSRGVFDGAQWIVEGRRGHEYHVVNRWSPEAGPYRDLGLLFLQLAGYVASDLEIY